MENVFLIVLIEMKKHDCQPYLPQNNPIFLTLNFEILGVYLIFIVSVSDTYLQQESNSDDVLITGNMSNATSASSIGLVDLDNVIASPEDVANDVIPTQSDVVVKTKSKMFFNFGSKKEKQKDIL
jgi:hypothetical protein